MFRVTHNDLEKSLGGMRVSGLTDELRMHFFFFAVDPDHEGLTEVQAGGHSREIE